MQQKFRLDRHCAMGGLGRCERAHGACSFVDLDVGPVIILKLQGISDMCDGRRVSILESSTSIQNNSTEAQ